MSFFLVIVNDWLYLLMFLLTDLGEHITVAKSIDHVFKVAVFTYTVELYWWPFSVCAGYRPTVCGWYVVRTIVDCLFRDITPPPRPIFKLVAFILWKELNTFLQHRDWIHLHLVNSWSNRKQEFVLPVTSLDAMNLTVIWWASLS